MFCGLYPHQSGIESNAKDESPREGLDCASTAFREHGYETAYFGKWHVPLDLKDPAVSGFDHLANLKHNGADLRLVDHALPWLATNREQPFFAVASFNNPHNICEWARGARGLELPDGSVPEPASLTACPPLRGNHQPPADETEALALLRRSYQASATFPVGDFDHAAWRRYQFAYHRMVELVDWQIGRLYSALRQMGLLENTVVVFCSDHGDCQGAHRWNQKTTLYEESVRVPCVVSWPGTIETGVHSELVQTGIDLMPTLLSVASIEVPHGLPGRNILDHDSAPEQVVSETRFVQGAPIDGITPDVRGRMLLTDRYKYCCYDHEDHRESLVDLTTDPGEMVNLARMSEFASVLESMRERLLTHCRKTNDPFVVEIPGVSYSA